MRVLLAQLNPTIGDLKNNCEKILKSIGHAQKEKVDLVVFPEMSLCGYPPEDLVLHASFIEKMEEELQRIVQATSGIMAVVGLVRKNPASGEKPLFNTAAIIQDKKLVGFADKCLLPTYDVFDERRYFEPGSRAHLWEWKGKKVAVVICEDIWQHAGATEYTNYAHDPVMDLVPQKPDLLVNISASPYQYQKPEVRIQVCAKSAKTLHCPVLLACQVGGNDELVFDGYSLVVGGDGKLRQIAKGFEEEEMLVDLDPLPAVRPFSSDPVEDLYKALVLGVRDYFHKLGFKKGCLGLSGGIDSALVACIAVDALGKENVLSVSMPSRYTASSSITDAEILARNLGVSLWQLPIEEPFKDYLKLLEPHFQKRPFDVAEENLQARIRGTLLMAISNKLGYILMSTGNKSEMAMGYATLYGDMCGGLSVIADVRKEQVYTLARWLNRKKEIIPQAIIDKVPTAELRPNQKDTDTLPEYAIVDAVLQAYVEEFLAPEEIAKKHQIPLPLVRDLIHKIHLAEYKRRQSPPAIRVTKKAFRSGRRYPIVQRWM